LDKPSRKIILLKVRKTFVKICLTHSLMKNFHAVSAPS
jgi:hypothetical protein